MTSDASGGLAPRACRVSDLSALISFLATLEGEVMTGEVSPHLTGRLQQRLQKYQLLQEGGTERDLRQALNDLNHRLRYALGEYDVAPSPSPVPD